MSGPFELFLFSTDPAFIRRAVAGGVSAVVVDWEVAGKAKRQWGFDTEINADTFEDLQRVRAATEARVVCRVNAFHPGTRKELEQALGGGADEVLLPMVRTTAEVQQVLEWLAGRAGLGILVETQAAVAMAQELARYPLSRVYVGLNDLAIDRGCANIFRALADGTVEQLRQVFQVPFGFGGLTVPDRGYPIPCRLLIGEMARLSAGFSFLRRSFKRDVGSGDPAAALGQIRAALEQARRRSPEQVASDHRELLAAIERAEAFFAARNRGEGL